MACTTLVGKPRNLDAGLTPDRNGSDCTDASLSWRNGSSLSIQAILRGRIRRATQPEAFKRKRAQSESVHWGQGATNNGSLKKQFRHWLTRWAIHSTPTPMESHQEISTGLQGWSWHRKEQGEHWRKLRERMEGGRRGGEERETVCMCARKWVSCILLRPARKATNVLIF